MEKDGILSMLAKATLTHMGTLEKLCVLWNPRSYSLHSVHRFAAPAAVGRALSPVQLSAGGLERLSTRLFLDSTHERGPERDLRLFVERLERWSAPDEGSPLPPRLLFAWGSFRFRGVIEELREEYVRFDADGTPVRAWVDLTLRR